MTPWAHDPCVPRSRAPDDYWKSSTRYGEVRAVLVDGDFAIVLDDLNADRREIELRLHCNIDGIWEQRGYQDDAGFPGLGQMGSWGIQDGVAFTFRSGVA